MALPPASYFLNLLGIGPVALIFMLFRSCDLSPVHSLLTPLIFCDNFIIEYQQGEIAENRKIFISTEKGNFY